MIDETKPWFPIARIHAVIDCPGAVLRRAVRRSGVPTMKSEEGRILVQKVSVRPVVEEAIRLGAKKR